MNKSAETRYPILDLLKNRWSPRAFTSQPVEPEKLLSLFEAARWSPSGGNQQPWAFIVTHQTEREPFEKLLGTLTERNQAWAKHAPVLVLSIVQRERADGQPNLWATYDVGQAVAHLSVQASAIGLAVHQMAGFDRQKAAELFALPEGYDPLTVFAIGYVGDAALLPAGLREREVEARSRKPLSDFVFDGAWQVPLPEEDRIALN